MLLNSTASKSDGYTQTQWQQQLLEICIDQVHYDAAQKIIHELLNGEPSPEKRKDLEVYKSLISVVSIDGSVRKKYAKFIEKIRGAGNDPALGAAIPKPTIDVAVRFFNGGT